MVNTGAEIVKLGVITHHHVLGPFHDLHHLVMMGPTGLAVGVLLTRGNMVQIGGHQVLRAMTPFLMTEGTLELIGGHQREGRMSGLHQGLDLSPFLVLTGTSL